MLHDIKRKVINGYAVSRTEALSLVDVPLSCLCEAADEIRDVICGQAVDFCCIINGKSGKCSENCRYCAQSIHFKATVQEYPLLSIDTILKDAKHHEALGVKRYSIVTSGKRLTQSEIRHLEQTYTTLKDRTTLSLCASHGLLSYDDFVRLKAAGLTRYHNNLETSKRFFSNICTSHRYEEKLCTLQAAKDAGLELCSGGIMGLGETWEDRIDLAFTLKELQVTSIPINFLNPIPKTPLENQPILDIEEMARIVAIYRFIHPAAFLRLAGGRGLMKDKGKLLLQSGANALITGDMLTTSGISVKDDKQMLKDLRRKVANV